MRELPLSEDEKGKLKLARAFEPMMRSEAWHFLAQIIEAHKQTHLNGIVSATTDIGGVLAGERDKGAYRALQMLLNLPANIVEEAKEIRKRRGEDPDDE